MRLEVFMNLNQDTIFIKVHAVDLNLDRFKNRLEYWTKFQVLSFLGPYIFGYLRTLFTLFAVTDPFSRDQKGWGPCFWTICPHEILLDPGSLKFYSAVQLVVGKSTGIFQ